MLIVNRFDKNRDMGALDGFATKRQLPLMEKGLLSDFGLIVSDERDMIVMGWLYPTLTSNFCIIENVISNVDIKNIDLAIELLFKELHLLAKNMDYKYIRNSVENKSMKKRLESYGYMKTQDNVTNYMGVL